MGRVTTDAGALRAATLPGLLAVSTRKAEAGLQDFRARVHVITGEMRDGAHVVPLPAQGGARVQGGSDHDMYEELGTRYRPGHPAFRPSMAAAQAAS